MVRLNSMERQKIYSLLMDGQTLIEDSINIWEIDPDEILMRKYRLSYCILLTHPFIQYDDIVLPNIEDAIYCKNMVLRDPSFVHRGMDEYIDSISMIYENLYNFGEDFLFMVLKESNWIIHQFFHLSDYEALEDEQIKWCQNAISYFMGYSISNDPQYRFDRKRFERLGCQPYIIDEFYPDSGLLLHNPIITSVLQKCMEKPQYKQEPEYMEIKKLLSAFLFGRFFPDLCNKAPKANTVFYESYLLCSFFCDQEETCDYHQINYETVIFYLLAEMASKDLLEKIEDRPL